MLTGSQQPAAKQQLHDRARRCRELAATALTVEARTILDEIAQRYERETLMPNIAPAQEPVIEAV